MTDYIYVSPDAIACAAADVGKATFQIGAVLDNLRTTLIPLAQQWTGDAYDAYQGTMVTWQTDIGEMNAALARINEAAWQIHDNYRATERNVVDAWA